MKKSEISIKIISIVGARPQFIKLAPLINTTKHLRNIQHLILHTGQHYDYNMDKIFFNELGIPMPNYHLGIGSKSHGLQTGEMLSKIEKILLNENPNWVIVYGDTNSTLAGAIAAAKLHIPIAHIEAGLRSFNTQMPEEINRILTDHCSNMLFCPTRTAVKQLKKEGFKNILNKGNLINSKHRINNASLPIVSNVGDIMHDSLLLCLKKAQKNSKILSRLNLKTNNYYLATVHRAENTDNPKKLKNILNALIKIQKNAPVVFPVHPRTRKIIKRLNLQALLGNIQTINPVSYFDMLILEKNAKLILTDSGGIQKEAYFLQTRCVTLREETEWIETLKGNYNIITGTNQSKIIDAVNLKGFKKNQSSLFGTGKTAAIIIELLMQLSK